MNKFLKKRIIWAVVITGVILTILWFFIYRTETSILDTRIIKRGDIVQEVSVTGRIKPSKTVRIGFEKSGRIQSVYARTGEHTDQGTSLRK